MPTKVVFLAMYEEAWDALDEIYRLMSSDARFDVTVITIPRRLTGDGGFGHEAETSAFLTSAGIPHLRFDSADPEVGPATLRGLEPDYVFINYPWQRNYQPGYRVERLAEYTRVCYVPYYSMPLVNEPGEHGVASHLFEQRSHQLASLVFTQDAAVLEAYASTERGNSYVHLTGSPKIDRLMALANEGVGAWPIAAPEPGPNRPAAGRPFRVVWAPHHSYSAAWLNFGMFAQTHREMLALALRHPEIDFVLRPHPFLFGTLVDRSVLSQTQLDHWLEDWNDLSNTAIHTDGEYATLFKATDLLVTDGISFIGEYPLVTGRPSVFLENEGHWEFSPLGELAADANIRLASMDGFEQLLDEVRTQGLPDRSEQIAALRSAASPYPGQAAQRIVEIVAADVAAGTPLVDKSLVRRTAWEFREGREPQVD
ncbi:MAG: hypothetical protein ACKOWK_04165 [Micrococcales bacterium]